jgi:hypothetical protein
MSKPRSKHTPLRLSADGTRAVVQLANAAGWSTNKSLGFIVQAGWSALNGGSDQIHALRQVMTAAIAHQETKVAMQKRLSISARKLRHAQSALGRKTGGAQ